MKIIRSKDFTASRAWGALYIANMNGITTRLHWTNQPYKWHVNEGEEIFAVLNGSVEMRYKESGQELTTVLQASDVFRNGARRSSNGRGKDSRRRARTKCLTAGSRHRPTLHLHIALKKQR